MNHSTIDYNTIALEYAQNRRLHPNVFKGILSTSRVKTDDRVLEVGCGTGNYILAFKSTVGCLCWGLDPSTGMVFEAKRRSNNVNFQLGNAETLQFKDNYFDIVYSVDVIHHVNNHFNYFQEARRVLKTGGKFCTVTDSEWIIRHRQPLAAYFPETVETELKRYPRIAQLKEIMKQAGFSKITEKAVEFHYKLEDIRAYQDKAFSALHLISIEAFQSGLDQMKKDLSNGPIPGVSRYLLLWGTK